MSDSAMKDDFELIEIYGKPAMFTNGRIDRFTVPEGWYCYDLRGSDNDPGEPATVEQYPASITLELFFSRHRSNSPPGRSTEAL